MQVREPDAPTSRENSVVERKDLRLFVILGSFFITNAILAEFLGVKIFSLEETLGYEPIGLSLLGIDVSFNLTAGVLLWPVVFIMTDIINEYYGSKGVRLLSFSSAALIFYGFIMVRGAMSLDAADFWIMRPLDEGGSLNMEVAFDNIFGQGLWIIAGSLVAFLIGQLVDVTVFHAVRAMTGSGQIWLRATGSTLVSQFIDSFVVLFIAFYVGAGWELERVLAIGIINYVYKFTVAVVLTPLLYLIHNAIDRYLGEELAQKLMAQAATQKTV